MTAIDRRTFLLASGAGLVVVACGGGSSSGKGADSSASPDTADLPADYFVVQRWIPTANVAGTVRLPFSIATADGLLNTGPDTFEVRIVDYDSGAVVVDPVVVERHQFDPRVPPFWVATVDLAAPGVYRLQALGADPEGAAVQILAADQVSVPKPGEPLPPFDTPTFDDPRGVDPICSRADGPCPFHEVTLTEALASGKPVIYIIGTPAHCSTGTCGPVLEDLIDGAAQLGDVVIVHADVYADDAATEVAPAVKAYDMQYEPVLWVTDATGTIANRFDSVWGGDEIVAAVAGLS